MAQLQDRAIQLRDRERQREAVPAGRPTVTVAFFCKWGKHRSVAMAHCFFHAWRTLGGEAHVEHISKPRWSRWGCGWDDCAECHPNRNHVRRDAVAQKFAALVEPLTYIR